MIIKSISISNFRPFFGNQIIEFSKGVNLINAQQGGGKTSLFSAFYWCLFNKIYNSTDKEWLEQPNYESVFNKQALKGVKEKVLECSVSIDITKIDEEGNEVTYTVVRKMILKEDANGRIRDANSFIVYYSDELGSKDSEGEDAKRFIEEYIFPKALSDYIWFQGEFLNRLIDLDNSNSFKKVVNTISYIEYYDKLESLLAGSFTKNNNSKIKKAREDKKNQKEKSRISSEIESKNKQLESNNLLIPPLEEELKTLSDREVELGSRITNNDKGKKILDGIKENLQKRKDCIKKREIIDERLRENLSTKWMIKGLDELIISAKERIYKVEMEFSKAQNEASELPIHTPDDQTLRKMLLKEECLVCGTSAPKDSIEWNRINELIGRATNAVRKTLDPEVNMINKAINELGRKPESIIRVINQIDEEVNDYLKQDQENTDKYNILTYRLDNLDHEKKELESKLQVSDLNTYDSELQKIAEQYKNVFNRRNSIEKQISQHEDQKRILNRELGNLNNQLNAILNSDDEEVREIKIEKILESLKSAVEETKKIEYNNLVKDIEDKTNMYLLRALEKNSSIMVQIKINPENNHISRIDKTGASLDLELNTGHDALINLCLIMAIIDKSSSYSSQSYTFLADAPTSNLDPIVSLDWTYLNSEVFEQSIILNKDLINFEDEAVKSQSIKSVYRLETNIIDSGKGEGIENQYSKIIKVK